MTKHPPYIEPSTAGHGRIAKGALQTLDAALRIYESDRKVSSPEAWVPCLDGVLRRPDQIRWLAVLPH